MRPDGLRRQRLTGGRPAGHGAGDVQPAWAPDGPRLAFVRTSKPSPDRSRIYLLDVAGGRATALTPGGRQIQSIDPAWSPDGRQIAYTRWNSRGEVGENAIVVAQADGSGERVLRRVGLDGQPDVMGQPAWSPDGAQILYTRYTTDRRHNFRPSLHVMDAATGDSRPLAGDAADGAWSPDGRRIAFSGVRDGNGKWCYEQCFISGEIYVMESDGTNLERLTRNRGNDAAPSWSPDGSRIVFESNRNVRDAPPSQGTEIYSIRADGSCLTWLTNGSPSSGDPAWRGSAFSPAQVGACGPVRRPPLVDVDVEALRASDRHPAYWLGNRHGSLLLGSAQGYEVGRRSLRTYAFFYDDCALYDVRSCRRGLQLQEDSVCSRQTTLAALARPHYRGGIAWRHGGRLLVSVGRDVVRVLTGGTQVTIFSQDGAAAELAGPGCSRPSTLCASSEGRGRRCRLRPCRGSCSPSWIGRSSPTLARDRSRPPRTSWDSRPGRPAAACGSRVPSMPCRRSAPPAARGADRSAPAAGYGDGPGARRSSSTVWNHLKRVIRPARRLNRCPISSLNGTALARPLPVDCVTTATSSPMEVISTTPEWKSVKSERSRSNAPRKAFAPARVPVSAASAGLTNSTSSSHKLIIRSRSPALSTA